MYSDGPIKKSDIRCHLSSGGFGGNHELTAVADRSLATVRTADGDELPVSVATVAVAAVVAVAVAFCAIAAVIGCVIGWT